MTSRSVRVRRGSYVDSVQLMTVSRQLGHHSGVEWARAVMGTEANVEELRARGFAADELAGVEANDAVLAVEVESDEAAQSALDEAEAALESGSGSGGGERPAQGREIRSLDDALAAAPEANIAVVSVPGAYATLEAAKALAAGLEVLLFSDNVALDDEVALKEYAAAHGRLVMGPGAGTAWLGGVGLGFANQVTPGRVGIVAAAGTGAQEAMVLVDRWGAGVSQVIGVGGRDLSPQVDARMTRAALRRLEDDGDTEVVMLVSKPPAPEVVKGLVQDLGTKPLVTVLLGLAEPLDVPDSVTVTSDLEQGAIAAVAELGLAAPRPWDDVPDATGASRGLPNTRTTVHGLFSGGTLCFEALLTIAHTLGPAYSNTPIRDDWTLPAPDDAHVSLDLGEEEFTQGRPHPMIDLEPRAEHILAAAENSHCAVILLDVVLGHGAHPDPASVLAPACAQVRDRDGGPVVVAYVLGTEADPQDRAAQVTQLEAAGCLLAPTAKRAALLACAIAGRRPELATEAGAS